MLLLRILLLFLLGIAPALAQPYVDIFSVKAEYFPGHMDAGVNTDSLSTENYAAKFLVPLKQKNGDVWLFNGNAGLLRFHYTGAIPGDADLYSLRVGAGFDKGWKNNRWRTLVMALPKINSDMKDGTTDDFQMGGLILFTRIKSDSLKLRFGVYYNREFFGNYFMPILGLSWKINDRWLLHGDLPSTMNLEYKVSSSFYTGFAYYSVVATYRLNSGHYVREGKKFWGYEQFKLFFNWHLTDHIVWFGEFGHTFGREYTLYNNDNEELNPLPVFGRDLDGTLFNTGISYRFRLDQ